MNYCENIKCQRISLCDYPCEPYTDYIINLSFNKNKKEIKIMDDTNIEDFLEYNVSDITWLRVINHQIPYTELINKTGFLNFLISENDKYCEENGLCTICRNPLEKFDSYEEVCGSQRLVESDFRCRYGCN